MRLHLQTVEDFAELLSDMREYDVPYVMRTAIDNDLRVGGWYLVEPTEGKGCKCVRQEEIVEKADVKILAFDIECTKAPLKFPAHDHDQIFMISYMCAGQGYLTINREVVSDDVQDFEYTPKPDFPGPFKVRVHASMFFAALLSCFGHARCRCSTNETRRVCYGGFCCTFKNSSHKLS